MKFHKEFLFGVATSGHQIEGNNINSDWYDWEINNSDIENSELACDSRNRYKEDVDIISKLRLDVYRFSVEWSRIEPKEGVFDKKELNYYLDLIDYLLSKDIEPFITLNHFTIPKWVADEGGWENSNVIDYFKRYVAFLIPHIKNKVKYVVTINEPTVYIGMSYLTGRWPPQKKNIISAYRVYRNMIRAHNEAYDIIKKENGAIQIGIVNQITDYSAYDNRFIWDVITCKFMNYIRARLVYKPTNSKSDFLGLNYYYQYKMRNFKQDLDYSLGKFEVFGWPVTPQGLYNILVRLKDMYNKPIFITENGISDKNDRYRKIYIEKHLKSMSRAIDDGVDVRGYMHWSLLDNFEWAEGYKSKFGLINVDFDNNQERKVRNSALYYSKLVKGLKNG